MRLRRPPVMPLRHLNRETVRSKNVLDHMRQPGRAASSTQAQVVVVAGKRKSSVVCHAREFTIKIDKHDVEQSRTRRGALRQLVVHRRQAGHQPRSILSETEAPERRAHAIWRYAGEALCDIEHGQKGVPKMYL